MVTYQLLLGALGLLCGIGVAAGVFALVASLGRCCRTSMEVTGRAPVYFVQLRIAKVKERLPYSCDSTCQDLPPGQRLQLPHQCHTTIPMRRAKLISDHLTDLLSFRCKQSYITFFFCLLYSGMHSHFLTFPFQAAGLN